MSAFSVIHLGQGDVSLMHDVLTMFCIAFGDSGMRGNSRPSSEHLERLLSKNHVVALAAVDGREVVGGLLAYVLEKPERERSAIYIDDLAVAQTHRRQGIATALVNKLRLIAKAEGASVVFAQANYSDHAATALYSKLGAREDVMRFDLEVTAR